MRGRLSFRSAVGLSLVLALVAGIAAAGVKVKLEDVPKVAVKAVEERFPKATIRYVERESNGDFEFAVKEGDRQFDVGVTARGKLLNIKEEMEEAKIPKAVKEALLKKYPGAKIVETEKVIVIDGKAEKVTYELKIKSDKKTREVVIDESGKITEE